jgi:hypothetical protein
MTFTIVTAFFDIGRGDWNDEFNRSTDLYFMGFQEYLNLSYNIVLYLDSRYYDKYIKLINLYPNRIKDIKLILIDEVWLFNNIWCWKLLDKETYIMQDPTFKLYLKNRSNFPEHKYPKYTLINHAKIDFIMNAIENNLINTDLIAWSDFGNFLYHKPYQSRPFDINKINKNKINVCIMNELDENDKNIFYTLAHAPEKMTGTFWIGPIIKMAEYQQIYHNILTIFQNNMIADDDQHIMIHCYLSQPELFQLHNFKNYWYNAFYFFQL